MTSSDDSNQSAYPKEVIVDSADALGITNLTEEGASILAANVEYRLKELIQEATKFMVHSKRQVLTMNDIKYALRLRRAEPVYGFNPSDKLDFSKVNENQQDLFYRDDSVISFDSLLQDPLPPFLPEITYRAHWLSKSESATEFDHLPLDSANDYSNLLSIKRKTAESTLLVSRRRKIKQNASLPRENLSPSCKVHTDLSEFKQRVLSAVFETVESRRDEVFETLRHHSDIQPLLSHFVQFIKDELEKSIFDVRKLLALLRFVDVLLSNGNLDFSEQTKESSFKKKSKPSESQLQKLIFPLLSCLLSRSLDNRNHVTEQISWDVRLRAGELLKRLRARYKSSFKLYIPKLYKTLKDVLLKPTNSLASLYGFVLCVEVLGPDQVARVFESNLEIIGNRIHSLRNSGEGVDRVLSATVDLLTWASKDYAKRPDFILSHQLPLTRLIERCSCPTLSDVLIELPNITDILNMLGYAERRRS